MPCYTDSPFVITPDSKRCGRCAADFLGCSWEAPDPLTRARAVESLRTMNEPPMLVLDTCQRLETYGLLRPDLPGLTVKEQWSESDAIERLARIAAGLDSRILGELEILGQVRNAYQKFRDAGGGAFSRLDRIFQQSLSIARRARKDSGIDANLTSLGALAARELIDTLPAGSPVAVVGSGDVASSVARYLGKRGNLPIRVASRCPENAASLALQVNGFSSGLDQLASLLDGVAGIITATAAPHPVIYAQHIEKAQPGVRIIDLGEPADCSPEVRLSPSVEYKSLLDVEAKAQGNADERRERGRKAEQIIRELADRHRCLERGKTALSRCAI
jgi:glutamyl-tRNA reductase